jgi:hypothetical protein
MMDGCPRLKMGYESCDAPLCDCRRAKETTAMSEMRELRYAGTDWRSVAVLEECERGHEFVKLPDHPLNGLGRAACPYCMAARTLSITDQEGLVEKVNGQTDVRHISDGMISFDELARAAILALREGVEEVPYCGIVVVPEGD